MGNVFNAFNKLMSMIEGRKSSIELFGRSSFFRDVTLQTLKVIGLLALGIFHFIFKIISSTSRDSNKSESRPSNSSSNSDDWEGLGKTGDTTIFHTIQCCITCDLWSGPRTTDPHRYLVNVKPEDYNKKQFKCLNKLGSYYGGREVHTSQSFKCPDFRKWGVLR